MVKEEATKLIKKHEGCELRMYRDTKGIETIGWGFNLRDRDIPQWVADGLLAEDVEMAMSDLDALIPWWRTLNEARQAALVDMSYNMGRSVLKQFKNGSLELIRQGRYAEAAANLRKSAWAKQTKSRAVRITNIIETGKL